MIKDLIDIFLCKHTSLRRKIATAWLMIMSLVVLVILLVGLMKLLGSAGVVIVAMAGITIWALIEV